MSRGDRSKNSDSSLFFNGLNIVGNIDKNIYSKDEKFKAIQDLAYQFGKNEKDQQWKIYFHKISNLTDSILKSI